MKDFSLSELRKINEAYCGMLMEAVRIGKDGYDALGFDADGYNQYGKNVFGINRDGYDDEGYDILGFDRDGWSRDGCPSPRRNPEMYGLKPEEVEDWIKSESEKRIARARASLTQRKSTGAYAPGQYARRGGKRKKQTLSDEESAAHGRLMDRLDSIQSEMRRRDVEKRRQERETYANSDAGRAEAAERKRKAAEARRSDEARARNAEYQRDYNRAMKLLYGSKAGHATTDDIIWMSTNPVFKRLKAKKEENERKAEEKRIRDEEEVMKMRLHGRNYRMVDYEK